MSHPLTYMCLILSVLGTLPLSGQKYSIGIKGGAIGTLGDHGGERVAESNGSFYLGQSLGIDFTYRHKETAQVIWIAGISRSIFGLKAYAEDNPLYLYAEDRYPVAEASFPGIELRAGMMLPALSKGRFQVSLQGELNYIFLNHDNIADSGENGTFQLKKSNGADNFSYSYHARTNDQFTTGPRFGFDLSFQATDHIRLYATSSFFLGLNQVTTFELNVAEEFLNLPLYPHYNTTSTRLSYASLQLGASYGW